MTDTTDDPKAPTYSRSLTRKERDDRNEQLLAQLKLKRELEPELAKAKLEAKRIVNRVTKQLETVNEMVDILALEVETGHAHVAKQLELGSVPRLADKDGNAVDDPRDSDSDDDESPESDPDLDDDDETDADGNPLPPPAYADGNTIPDGEGEGEPGVRPGKKRKAKAAKKRNARNGARATA